MTIEQLINDAKKSVEDFKSAYELRLKSSEGQLTGLVEQIKKLEDGILQIEKKANEKKFVGGVKFKSLSEQFLESEQYQDFMKSNDRTKTYGFKVENGKFSYSQLKNAVTKANEFPLTTDSDVLDSTRHREVIFSNLRPITIFDVMNTDQLDPNSGSFEYVKETNFFRIITAIAVALIGGETDIVVENAQGFIVGSTISINDGPAKIDRIIGAINTNTNTITLTVALPAGAIAAGTDVYSSQFKATAEAQLKPNTYITFTREDAKAKTFATILPVTKQMMRMKNAVRNQIDNRLAVSVMQQIENAILYGDGSSETFTGLMVDADVTEFDWSDGEVGDTKADCVKRALTIVEASEYMPNAIILNPYDKTDMQLAKSADDGHYMVTVQLSDTGISMLWGVKIITTTAMTRGEYVCGAFDMAALFYWGEMPNLEVSGSHADFFAKNMYALRLEAYCAFEIVRPASFVRGAFDSAPT